MHRFNILFMGTPAPERCSIYYFSKKKLLFTPPIYYLWARSLRYDVQYIIPLKSNYFLLLQYIIYGSALSGTMLNLLFIENAITFSVPKTLLSIMPPACIGLKYYLWACPLRYDVQYIFLPKCNYYLLLE